MKFVNKTLFPFAALSALFLTACGGEDAEAPTEVVAPAELKIPDAPDAAMELIAKELAGGNGGILWKAMPVSYQGDINAIAQLVGAKVDPEVYDQAFSLVGRLAQVADKQKAFVLGTELMGESDPAQLAEMEAAWPSVIGFVDALTSSSIASVDGLLAFDGQSFFDSTVSTLIKYSEGMSALGGEELPISAYGAVLVKALESTETTATLEMTAPDGEVEVGDFSKIEGRWVPTEMAEGWVETMTGAKAQLEAISPEDIAQQKPQIMSVITMLDGVLSQIDAAETQEQFDQALQGAMMPIMGLMMMQQGMGGSAPHPPMPGAPVAP